MYCKKCGQELNEGSKFCAKCGTPTSVVKEVAQRKETIINREKANGKDNEVIKISKKTLRKLVLGVVAVVVIVIGVIVFNTKNHEQMNVHKVLDGERDKLIEAFENGGLKVYEFGGLADMKDAFQNGDLGYQYYDYNGDGYDDLIIGNMNPSKLEDDRNTKYTIIYLIEQTFQVKDEYKVFIKHKIDGQRLILLEGNELAVQSLVHGQWEESFVTLDSQGIRQWWYSDANDLVESHKPIKLKLKKLK